MKKLFVTDLDGTLVENNKITKGNYKAIENLKKLNHCVAIATGRPYNGVEFLKEDYNLKADYFILLNGALILDGDLNLVQHKVVAYEIAKEITETYSDENWSISVESGFKTFIVNGDGESLPYPEKNIVNGVEAIKQEKIALISMYYINEDIEYVDKVCKEINEKYGDYVVAYRNVKYIDIVPLGCSKGAGVEYIKDKENINKELVYSIGDSWNDVSMFKASGKSFTFNHAEKALHNQVDYLVNSVEECVENYL